ncbi:MAG TPA: glucose 1-dehydrogenase [Candidatus Acidoferrales bacterium]|nr:glucose 1-dehydrogenase [Candidatus Acidoferrales bacterium]
MKAIAVTPGTAGSRLVDRPEPAVSADDDVKLRVLRVGICGTDREEVSGGRALAPAGQKELVIGHEMFGQVVGVGAKVARVKPGDYAAFTVRRGCGKCSSCQMNRSDMCETGQYTERGIWGRDGYEAEYVVDKEQYVVNVAAELAAVGVLIEPLSIVEKAIDEALRLQVTRRPDAATIPDWLVNRRCLVAGLGPVGLLAALVLRLRGGAVHGLDVVDEASARPEWLKQIGGKYIDGRKVKTQQIAEAVGPMEFIFEATGIASLEFNLLEALSLNGAYVLTGIPGGDRPIQVPGATLMRQLVLRNQVMLGSVNAARGHYQMAADDLEQAHLRWSSHIAKLITHRHARDQAAGPLAHHQPDAIKEVVEWA